MADKDPVADDTADGSTQQKKRARRRLVGAIALALLAVIVLPMVMDHEPRPAAQDIQVRIPSQDAATPSARTPVVAPPAASPAVPAPAPEAQSVPPAAPETTAPPAAAPKAEPKPEPAAAKKPEAKTEAVAAKKPEAKSESKSDNKAELARAERALSGAAGEQWVLQLGAYQDGGNVKLLQAKIKELGYPSYTEKVDTPAGARIRVRAGPFATQAAAQAAQARLKKIGAGGPPGGVLSRK